MSRLQAVTWFKSYWTHKKQTRALFCHGYICHFNFGFNLEVMKHSHTICYSIIIMQGFGLMYGLSWKMEAQRKKNILFI